ncbi:signal transduction histidine kinase [Bernardetia litoralis DSM 6794]|uniref:histidine kinase n=1 Tax=Bernardetia litoralis (strain ATCC 23117 / DSM 6794 / NBRC 15988 / NCIMB 1366 / Fx l1 / Sio-4) TaxID=880071 RepID=I4AMQ1_BERLS|nr:HAMP domain-containing sensor histidine kinase [Bernardetia litoralis]AFM05236.1 signal transduction histidine kinase [Bernardetia litoralis DSM 6794]
MNKRTITLLLIFALLSIFGIISIQIYWVQRAFDANRKQNEQKIQVALQHIARKIAAYSKTTLPSQSPINQISSDYYTVSVNCEIDAAILEYFLKNEFSKRNIQTDFEYGIYDCDSEKMVYGNYISLNEDNKKSKNLKNKGKFKKELPKWEGQNYYFGIRFPSVSSQLVSEMDIWIFLSVILLLVIFFLVYGMFFIITQKQFSQAQKQFINNITHELKTPISILGIASNVLIDNNLAQNSTKEETRKQQYAIIVKEQTERLNSQVEKLVELLMLERSSYVPLSLEKINLQEIIQETTQSFELEILAKQDFQKQDFKIQFIDIENQTFIKTDKVHFQNMLHNLLENAFKYNQNTPFVEISILIQSKNKLIISIKDNGIGIDKKFQKRIFDKFFRIQNSDIHATKGFGLGLSYIKQVVRAHKWKIKVESNLNDNLSINSNTGTTFFIEIPY